MVYLLSACGHEVLQAHEGREGLQQVASTKPDLILLDIHMPEIDGYEVARRLRADPACSRIPIVAVTALAMVGDREKILASGFNGYVAKPIEAEVFLSQVSDFISQPARHPAAAPAITQNTAASATGRGKKQALVLFVDNAQTNIDLVRSILEPSGFQVAAALSAREGLDLARRTKPDLIISDVHMPYEDGYSFMRMLQGDPGLRDIPFVFLSASAWTARQKAQALQQGARKCLSRPIEPQALLEELNGCLERGAESNG